MQTFTLTYLPERFHVGSWNSLSFTTSNFELIKPHSGHIKLKQRRINVDATPWCCKDVNAILSELCVRVSPTWIVLYALIIQIGLIH